MSHGVELQTSFTYGRSIDTGSAVDHGDQFSNSISSLPWYDLKSIRGPSDFNVTRTLVINLTWQLPSPKLFSGPAAWITNGWELGGIYKASDGTPFTATFGTGGDPQGLNNSDDWAFPNRLTGPGCRRSPIRGIPTTTSRPSVSRSRPRLLRSSPLRRRVQLGPAPRRCPVGAPPAVFESPGQCRSQHSDRTGISNLDFSVSRTTMSGGFRRISTCSSGRNFSIS